jgi:hypothetical protein
MLPSTLSGHKFCQVKELLTGVASGIDEQGSFAKVDFSYPPGQLEFTNFSLHAHLQNQLDK